MNRRTAASVFGVAYFCAAGVALSAEVGPTEVVFTDDGAIAESLTGVAGDAAAGGEVMVDRGLGNCAACHVISTMPDVQFPGTVGPELSGVGGRYDEAHLRGIVVDAKHTFPDTIMPSFYKSTGFIRPGEGYTNKPATEPLKPILSAQQVEDVVAYLLTMK